MATWIETFSGKHYNPLKPSTKDIAIEDIAHSLSMQCRFSGHCREFYSVAEHCVRMLELTHVILEYNPLQHWIRGQLAILLHDASEAYLTDIPRPIKPYVYNYLALEKENTDIINKRFNITDEHLSKEEPQYGIGRPINKVIHDLDLLMLSTETRDLGMNEDGAWGTMPPPVEEIKIEPYSPKKAKELFLKKYFDLTLHI